MLKAELARKGRLHPVWNQIGLIAGQPRVLSKLLKKDDVTQKELSVASGVDPATLSRLLDRLEAMGFIRREEHPTCRRALRIVLTDSGREKAGEVREIFQSLETQMFQDFSEKEMETFNELLERTVRNLQIEHPGNEI